MFATLSLYLATYILLGLLNSIELLALCQLPSCLHRKSAELGWFISVTVKNFKYNFI